VDLQMRMNWCRCGSTILDGASGVLESKVSVPTKWSIWIGRTWGGVFEVLGTRDDKLLES
jgi:hypothetical protein